ncbi:Ion transport protein-domain-containing protein [Boletus reticuloceps]|uniref:Calcium-channel protein CCH1 n=1 Tax=Boletus reticuloceps TaxID=495285 RepID=A0A8I2YI15_9AGAM|nr:Ion transport protein-domain-containing protein [Boletus reticuloceps]
MEANAGHPRSRTGHSSNGSSSAVDISGLPSSPALQPSDASAPAYTHRRLSWSNAEGGPDSPPATQGPGPSNLELPEEHPVFSLVDCPIRKDFPSSSSTPHPHAFPTSLFSTLGADADTTPDDDKTRLIGEAEPQMDGDWPRDLSVDSERSAGITSQSRRRYTTPLRIAIMNVFRRASMRVANVRGPRNYNPIREGDEHSDAGPTLDVIEETTEPDDGERVASQPLPSGPLRGRAFGILGPTSPLRLRLYKLLIHPYTEPTILALILINAVALVVQASRTLLLPDTQVPITVKGYFHAWEDFVIFVLFILFTIEALGRICISGLLLDPEVPISSIFSLSFFKSAHTTSTHSASSVPLTRSGSLARGYTLRRVYHNVAKPFSISLSSHARNPSSAQVPDRRPSSSALHGETHSGDPELPPTFLSRIMKSDVQESDPNRHISLPFRLDMEMAQSKIVRNIPYLRQGWGRIDFLAVIGFWVSFGLSTAGLERGTHHIGIFRALGVLRIARLLSVTNGTTTIMRSLKIARPLLANVICFIIFAVMLFSVIGVQSFKTSLRRSCNLLPVLGENSTPLSQTCGGHINATTLAPSPYLNSDGISGSITKGFICPLGQVCQEGDNPFGGVESFDTMYYAILQIVVLASASSWSRIMYQIIGSESAVASIFFIFGILVLNFWLFNLLVGVITNSFSAIRSGTKKSAFGAAPLGHVEEETDEGWSAETGHHVGENVLKVWWSYTRWFWVLLAFASLVAQATTTADMSAMHRKIINITELLITFAFDIEIVVRIAVELPAWRNFFLHGSNWLDLIIAIGSSVIQIPAIHDSRVYPWLTVFQLARFHRVLLVVPRMKPLMLTVFGNMYGLVNMTLFLMLVTFLAALFAIQLLQGDMDGNATMNFAQLFNSFLAVYQILSGENWTAVLYDATDAELKLGQAIIVCTFLCCWLLFSNFIVMQMFIAVINENFDVAEETKRKMQASNYSGKHSQTTGNRWTNMLNPYLWFKTRSTTVNAETSSSTSVLENTKTLVQQDPFPVHHGLGQRHAPPSASNKSHHIRRESLGLLSEIFTGNDTKDDIPLLELHQIRSELRGLDDQDEREIDRCFDTLAKLKKRGSKDSGDIHRTETMELIQRHRTYDRTFWIFSQANPLRRLCQRIVRPSCGERIFGTPTSGVAHTFFQLAILLAVIGSIATEAVATPLYRRDYYMQHGAVRDAWFHVTEATFGLILVVEFLIKIIADGLLFTPNAYIRSIWNIIDSVIMVGVLANVTFTLVFVAGLSRFIRALKALQALRLMTLIDKMRSTFEDLILAGFIRILDAAVLSMLYLIPFSVWGTTIFAGLTNECNDTGVQGIGDCTNEYVNSIYGGNFGFLVPRVWDNPAPSTTFSFDNFPASLLILFEIVSSGWTDVMSVATSITGKGQQPQPHAAQANAIFFVTFNLLGAVIVGTLFVSIIIGNFSLRTGSAYLTDAQREWIDLQRLIKRLKPSKRPKVRPSSPFQAWCYDRAIHKHGWWTRMMTFLFVVQIIVLMTQSFSAQTADDWHNIVSLIISLMYVVDTTIRLYGLGWRSFSANGWNLFDVLVASGSFLTTLFARFYPGDYSTELLQKLFLVSMAFKLVQRVAILNQLFKTGTASISVILNLLALWFTLFLFFAIMYMEVFGLTKWYSGENIDQNFQTMGSALLMLVSMSTGEGWNQFMHDYTLAYPRCTQVSYGIYQTDCGSTAWAFSLFIAWNLLSMFIFVNMFTGVVVESFSYVFQSTGGLLKSITRHETRAFKKAWAQFSDPKTGLLERPNLVPFLAKLDGVFEVRIYPSHYSISSILEACQDKSTKDNETGGIHVRKLNRLLSKIDFEDIRMRRAVYMRIYHEANVMYYRGKGISFTEMLMLLAHHKLIDDREALGLKELEVREEMLKLVADLVGLDMVRSQLRMISLRREFVQLRERMLTMAKGSAIPPTPIHTTPGISLPRTSAAKDIGSHQSEGEWHSEQDPTSPKLSPRTLLPSSELEGMGSRENLLNDPDDVHSPRRDIPKK